MKSQTLKTDVPSSSYHAYRLMLTTLLVFIYYTVHISGFTTTLSTYRIRPLSNPSTLEYQLQSDLVQRNAKSNINNREESNNNSKLNQEINDNNVDKVATFENTLLEMESMQLYGNTPKLIELDNLAHWLRNGKLNIAPKYQRGYVWKSDRASRLVITVLCNRIVPAVVLHEIKKGKYDVVDGKQRITSLLSFYLSGKDPGLHKTKLEGCSFDSLTKLDENYDSLEGLTFNDLTEERQDALASFSIPCVVIPYTAPKEDVFACYEDINSGGEELKAQQLRRAVYYGKYIEMLDVLVQDENFQCIRDPKAFRKGSYTVCSKESDCELILRAFAWSRNHRKYKRPLKTFLNDELQHYENLKITDGEDKMEMELKKLKDQFQLIMRIWRNVFSETDGAFRRWEMSKNGSWVWTTSIVPSFWDVMYLVCADLLFEFPTEPIYISRKDELRQAIQTLFEKGKLELTSTVTVSKFMERREILINALQSVLREGSSSSSSSSSLAPPSSYLSNRNMRFFPKDDDFKKELYKLQEGMCTICNGTIDINRLTDGRYVHLDHTIPHSKGGATNRQNAALTHAACNQSKGNKIMYRNYYWK